MSDPAIYDRYRNDNAAPRRTEGDAVPGKQIHQGQATYAEQDASPSARRSEAREQSAPDEPAGPNEGDAAL